MWQWHDLWVRAQLGGIRGDPAINDDHYARLLQAAEDSGMVYIQILSRVAWAHSLAPKGCSSRLATLVQEARTLCTGTVFAYLENELRLTEALAAMRSHDAGAEARMASALQGARRSGYPWPTMQPLHRPASLPICKASVSPCGVEWDRCQKPDALRAGGLAPGSA